MSSGVDAAFSGVIVLRAFAHALDLFAAQALGVPGRVDEAGADRVDADFRRERARQIDASWC